MPTQIYFVGHDNFGNRGCEALVRSSVATIREVMPHTRFSIPSRDPEADACQWSQSADTGVCFVPPEPIPLSIKIWNRIRPLSPGSFDACPPTFRVTERTRSAIAASDAVVMTGGDVLSLDYGLLSLYYWTRICEVATEVGKPIVLWAASVGPFSALPSVEKRMRAFLECFDLITVRESATQHYLESLGLGAPELVADPAFCLDCCPAPEKELKMFSEGPVLGLNLSPLFRQFRTTEASRAELDRGIVAFLEHVLRDSKYRILLIPHVDPLDGQAENSDSLYMSRLLACLPPHLQERCRIRLLSKGLNAAQLKDIIRRCTYFIGARTHSTIAAVSTGVPTTFISYSVKSKGISKDLFGHSRYVLDTPRVSAATLAEHFQILQSERNAIIRQFAAILPEWRTRARRSARLLGALLS